MISTEEFFGGSLVLMALTVSIVLVICDGYAYSAIGVDRAIRGLELSGVPGTFGTHKFTVPPLMESCMLLTVANLLSGVL
jgi:hypothetical protein